MRKGVDMRCWVWHDWGKWSDAKVVGVTGRPGEEAIVQERYCDKCGKYQRQARYDGGR